MSCAIEPAGDEFQVNTYTTLHQVWPSISALADGGFIVVWGSNGQDGSGYGIYGQRYDSAGNPVGSEFQVNSYTADHQIRPSVAALADGGFVVTWHSNGQDGSGAGVYAQRYDSAGNAVGGEFQVNTYEAGGQEQSSVAALADGGFIVIWTSYGQNDGDITAQRYDAAGNAVGGEFQVNSYTFTEQLMPSIAVLSDGGYVIAWTSFEQDGSDYGIHAQRYDAAGNPVGSEFQVNSYTSSDQFDTSIAALADGGFVVTWTSDGQDGSGYGIYGQRYDAAGNAVGSEFHVSTYTDSNQHDSSVAALDNGGFIVTWASVQDGSGAGVYAQVYDADGNAVGSEYQINAYTFAGQGQPSVTTLADGTIAIVWSSTFQDGSFAGVFANLYSAGGTEFVGGNGADTLAGTPGCDTISGANGDDWIHGGGGDDLLFGDNGDDHLFGEGGSDVLQGSRGNDTLDGGAGNDTLDGGQGDDMLTGGSGDDQFIVTHTGGNDTITDFEEGADSLVLNDGLSVSSLQHSGDDTIVHLSNGATVTLLGVSLSEIDDLYSPAAELALAPSNSDALIV